MKVVHFVSGGFSGSTNVAKEIIKATNQYQNIRSSLVLRRKKSTTEEKLKSFREMGIETYQVSGALHVLTIYQLYKLCKKLQPDILVVHGFSEHLWGRYAGLLAKVPHMVHVEHNSKERYSKLRLKQAMWLAKYTDKIVGCSKGVQQALLNYGFPEHKTTFINNGINPAPFKRSLSIETEKRLPEFIMAARFARQKDQLSLIEATQLLKQRNIRIKVNFAGLGNKRHLHKAQAKVNELGLTEQIHFLGHCTNIPELLLQHQFFVFSTKYEGMPLSVIEAMMSGCTVIASKVIGVQEMFEHENDGYLVEPQSPQALADAIERLLSEPELAQKIALAGQQKAMREFTIENMANQYIELFNNLIGSKKTCDMD